MAFDPDAYLAQKSSGGFSPDAYLASSQTPQKSLMTQAMEYPAKTYQGDLNTFSGMGKAAMDFIKPPTSLNMPGEFDQKRQILEAAGNKVKQSALGAEGNIVSNISELAAKHLPSYLANAVQKIAGVGGGAVATATELAPTTPGDFASMAAGEMLPPMASGAMRGTAESVANRWANAPKWIREARLEKGLPSVGEDVLNLPKGEVGDLAVNDKKAAFNAAKMAEQSLGQKIRSKIDELFKSGTDGVNKNDVANSMDEYASKLDAPDAERLMSFKEGWLKGKPDNLDFKLLNQERVKLGEEIGKDFGKTSPELAHKTEAQKAMWQFLRNKLGELSPELDEMLQLQHKVMDIKNSVKPEAALGYTPVAETWRKALLSPLTKNVGLADFVANRLPQADMSNLGATAAYGAAKTAIPLSEQLRNK